MLPRLLLPVTAAVALLAGCAKEPPTPAATQPAAELPPGHPATGMPPGHPAMGMPPGGGDATAYPAAVPIDVCGTFPLAPVEAALGSIRKARPLVASGTGGPSPFAGGCQWIAEKMKSARVEIGNAESLAAVGQPDAKSYVEQVARAGMRNPAPIAGLGEAALLQDEGSVVIVIAGAGTRLVHVISGDIGRDATIAIARAALQ